MFFWHAAKPRRAIVRRKKRPPTGSFLHPFLGVVGGAIFGLDTLFALVTLRAEDWGLAFSAGGSNRSNDLPARRRTGRRSWGHVEQTQA
jgi:hypothetical protein